MENPNPDTHAQAHTHTQLYNTVHKLYLPSFKRMFVLFRSAEFRLPGGPVVFVLHVLNHDDLHAFTYDDSIITMHQSFTCKIITTFKMKQKLQHMHCA